MVDEKVSKINSLYFKYEGTKKEIIQLNNSIMNLNGLKSEITKNRQNIEKNKLENENNLNLLLQNKEQKNKSIEKINLHLNKLVETNLKKIELKTNLNIVQKEYETINESFQNLLMEKKQIEKNRLFNSMYINDEFVISEKYKIDWTYDYSVDSKNAGFAYSCLSELPNHQIGLMYEKYDSYNPAELHSQDIN